MVVLSTEFTLTVGREAGLMTTVCAVICTTVFCVWIVSIYLESR